MDQIPDSLLTLTAYAARRGVSKMAVSRAIKVGRLKECVVRDAKGQPKIKDAALADVEWDRNTDPQRRVNAAGGVDPRAAFDPRPAIAARVAALEGPFEAGDVATNQERLTAAKADIAELQYAEKAGELVPADQVMREWADVLSQVRTKMLGIPTALKQAIPHLTVEEVVIIENAIREALSDAVAAETAEAP